MICFSFAGPRKSILTAQYMNIYSIAIVLYKNEMTMKMHIICRQEIHQNRRTQLLEATF